MSGLGLKLVILTFIDLGEIRNNNIFFFSFGISVVKYVKMSDDFFKTFIYFPRVCAYNFHVFLRCTRNLAEK